jgi:hypothetical protein
MIKSFIKIITSLKLTVVCLSMSMVVVFFGTMAQDPLGLYIAQERFFHSFFIDWTSMLAAIQKTLQMVDIYVATPVTGADVLSASFIPVFPGGYLLGFLLLFNLIAAHITRFKFTKARAGIFLTHIGIILLLVGQLFTDLFAKESSMRLEVGETRNFTEDFRKNELVIIDLTDPDHDTVVAIPESKLRKGGVIEHDQMPFKLRVLNVWQNSDIANESKPGFTRVEADQGPGAKFHVKELPPVTAMEGRDLPSIVVEIIDGDHGHGKWFLSALLKRQSFEHHGKQFAMTLRFKRYYTPYSLTLLEANHDKYKGTEIPRNFSSLVNVKHAAENEEREVKIFMNNPLRYEGKTFYQYQMAADEMFLRQGMKPTSTFQVVENPSWLAPYAACVIVGLGLLLQFMMHFVKFIQRNKAKA